MRDITSGLPLAVLETMQRATLRYTYRGILCLKNPFDFALYTKLIHELAPRTIIEIGSHSGGSALWMADMLRAFGIDGHVYSIDIRPVSGVTDERIEFVTADVRKLGETLSSEFLHSLPGPILVIEDGAHFYDTTIAAMRFFAPILRPGDYLLVEDGIVNDLVPLDKVYAKYDNGPNRAIFDFLAETGDRFEIDTDYCDFFGHNYTYNTNGYLKCVR